MIIQAGDLGVEIYTGGNRPGAILHLDGDQWKPYRKDGRPINWPVRLEQLEPGRYRERE